MSIEIKILLLEMIGINSLYLTRENKCEAKFVNKVTQSSAVPIDTPPCATQLVRIRNERVNAQILDPRAARSE